MAEPLVRIPREQLNAAVGKHVHLAWASHGCVWRLVSVDGEVAHLETPKTRKKRTANVSDLCYTRSNQPLSASSAVAGEG